MTAGAALETGRLALAVPTPRDAAAVLAILGDPRAVAHNPSDRLTDEDDARALVARWRQHWAEHGFGYWCVRERGLPRVVGYSGVKRMTVHEHPVLNLIYRFAPDVWGAGYGSEVATAVVAWARANHPQATILARVRPDNLASQRVARKAGLQRDPALDDDGEDGPDLAFTSRPAGRPR